jgi:hypothetical protein
MPHRPRLPVSTRHAFALAFDLAFRRDPVHSLVVPLLVRAPWAVASGLLPDPESTEVVTSALLGLATLALVGDFLTFLVVTAMLRVRARSVFNTPPGVRPMAVRACYAAGLRRIPWLFVTESVRNFVLGLVASFSILPAVFVRLSGETFIHDLGRNLVLLLVAACLTLPFILLGGRLAVATESVVLDEHDLGGAFQRSWRIMEGRFERWFELVGGSALIVLATALVSAFLTVMFPILAGPAGASVLWLLIIAVTPVVQYAWTFFYLRLIEVETPLQEVGPMYAEGAGMPRPLGLVPPADTRPGPQA